MRWDNMVAAHIEQAARIYGKATKNEEVRCPCANALGNDPSSNLQTDHAHTHTTLTTTSPAAADESVGALSRVRWRRRTVWSSNSGRPSGTFKPRTCSGRWRPGPSRMTGTCRSDRCFAALRTVVYTRLCTHDSPTNLRRHPTVLPLVDPTSSSSFLSTRILHFPSALRLLYLFAIGPEMAALWCRCTNCCGGAHGGAGRETWRVCLACFCWRGSVMNCDNRWRERPTA